MVLAESARDPDLAPWAGSAHLGRSFLLAGAGAPAGPWLGYWTAMERQEAAATGCALLTPEALGITGLVEQGLAGSELWSAVVGRGLRLVEAAPCRAALAGHPPAGAAMAVCRQLSEAGWELADSGPLLQRLRKQKSAAELDDARRAAAGLVAAMRKVAELLAAAEVRDAELWLAGERLTAGRLRAAVAAVLAGHGLEQPEGNIVAAGRDAAVPHNQGGSEVVLRAGESLVVDLFPRHRLFADCTRTFCVGPAGEALVAAHGAVRDALLAARRRAVAGARGWDLQAAACDLLEARGYATARSRPDTVRGYVHGLGHGVGYELHELPSFRRSADEADGRLEQGDLFTLEPGLYDPEAGYGVRLEDLCALEAGGVELLTPLPLELDPRAWSG